MGGGEATSPGGFRGGGMNRGGMWEKLGQDRRKAIQLRGFSQRSMGVRDVGWEGQRNR